MQEKLKRRGRWLAGAACIATMAFSFHTAIARDRGWRAFEHEIELQTQPASFSTVAKIQLPGNPLLSFDFTFVDPVLPFYYFTDRSNAAIDVIDVFNNRLATQITGFVGAVNKPGTTTANPDVSGPNSVVSTTPGEIWATDGDSSVKVISLYQGAIVDTISTTLPGTTAAQDLRADGMSYDPRDRIIMAQNGAANPPFVTLISANPNNRHVLGHIVYGPDADVEASVYNPLDGLFYVNIAQTGDDPNVGAVSLIDPRTVTEVARFPVTGCNGAGIALSPEQTLLLACSLNNGTQIIDPFVGKLIANIPQVSGSDQATYNYADGNFYVAARTNAASAGGPVVGVISAATNQFVANIPSDVSAHVIAADTRTNHVFVPRGPNPADPDCLNGCITVYAGQAQTWASIDHRLDLLLQGLIIP